MSERACQLESAASDGAAHVQHAIERTVCQREKRIRKKKKKRKKKKFQNAPNTRTSCGHTYIHNGIHSYHTFHFVHTPSSNMHIRMSCIRTTHFISCTHRDQTRIFTQTNTFRTHTVHIYIHTRTAHAPSSCTNEPRQEAKSNQCGRRSGLEVRDDRINSRRMCVVYP